MSWLYPFKCLLTKPLLSVLAAQSIAGTWQGTLAANGRQYREVLHVAKAETGWVATVYNVDARSDSLRSSSWTLEGSRLVITFARGELAPAGGSFNGQLDSGGRTITGVWTEADGAYPLTLHHVSGKDVWPLPLPHAIRFVTVDTNVKLEVLDWGGRGPPIVFLAGLGGTAHVFDLFAPRFGPRYHVYGITRRGFGESSAPAPTVGNYTAARLGDDVLAVLDSLHLARPVLVGHSIVGEELSAIGSRHPDRVAGLVYLDAGYSYAYYDSATGNILLDRADLVAKLHRLDGRFSLRERRAITKDLLQTDLPRVERDLRRGLEITASDPDSLAVRPEQPNEAIGMAIIYGGEKFTHVPVPVLAIFAVPHDVAPPSDSATTAAQANAFEAGIPTARVVRLPHANHGVFSSNADDVLREMSAFLARTFPSP